VLVLWCGTVILAGWCAVSLSGLEGAGIENGKPFWNPGTTYHATTASADVGNVSKLLTPLAAVAASHLKLPTPNDAHAAVSPRDRAATDQVPFKLAVASAPVSAADAVAIDPAPRENAIVLGGASSTEASVADGALPDSRLPTPPETREQVAALFTSDPAREDLQPAAHAIDTLDECLVILVCIDDYLWSLYERTPKIDTNRVTERIKSTVKRNGKSRTVIKTLTKRVVADFTWKDPIAAQRAGMSVKDYVIGGMDRGFRLKLYRALRAMDEAGLMPGITSAFRDDYRQAIATGNKAASDSSYHGGSRRGGYGHGLAVDLVSVRGETRMERFASSVELWKWVDAHENEFGIGRPYLDRDPPHVAPIDGREYAAKRGRLAVQRAGL